MLVSTVKQYIPGDQAWKHQSKLSFGALVFSVFPPVKLLQRCSSMNSLFCFSHSSVLNEFKTKNMCNFFLKKNISNQLSWKTLEQFGNKFQMHFQKLFLQLLFGKQTRFLIALKL